jgi:hypothetical protein
MGLNLVIFAGDPAGDDEPDEIDSLAVGSYSDFGDFRDAVLTHVEAGRRGSRCPVLQLHSDCDGEWTPEDCVKLRAELALVKEVFVRRPPVTVSGWRAQAIAAEGVPQHSLLDAFVDPDGQLLVDRLDALFYF